MTGCTSVLDPAITSGTLSVSGDATVNTAAEVVTDTTDTITWNTGATTTVSEARTFTVVFTSVADADADAGAGDRSHYVSIDRIANWWVSCDVLKLTARKVRG